MSQGPGERPGGEVPWWSQPQPARFDPISSRNVEPSKTTRLPVRLLLAMTLVAGVLGGGI